jgi:hypothetical protein
MIGLIMKKSVSKLVDLDIDEVSLVDRSANQHSLVSFSKSLAAGEDVNPEDSMSADFPVFNEEGEEVDSDTLEHGDVVYAEDGTELVMVADDEDEVGKAFAVNTAGSAVRSSRDLVHVPGRAKTFPTTNARRRAQQRGKQVGEAARARVDAAPAWAKYGATAAAAGGAGYAGGSFKKSLSDSILEDFSKAVTERDREEIIAKAMDEVSKAQEIAAEALAYAESEHDARMEEAFISKAAEYNLPVSPEVFGPILKSLAYALDEDQLEILDAIFNAVGDALYNEIGYVGDTSNSSVLDQVDALAGEYVGKSDMSHAQAVTAMFEANPSAYDAYISENGR